MKKFKRKKYHQGPRTPPSPYIVLSATYHGLSQELLGLPFLTSLPYHSMVFRLRLNRFANEIGFCLWKATSRPRQDFSFTVNFVADRSTDNPFHGSISKS